MFNHRRIYGKCPKSDVKFCCRVEFWTWVWGERPCDREQWLWQIFVTSSARWSLALFTRFSWFCYCMTA